jgi:hypothetical protein
MSKNAPTVRRSWIIYAVLLAGLAVGAKAFGERAPEDRRGATHVILGTVAGVYSREEKGTRNFLVEIAIEKVEKGDGFRPGGTFYVGCYLWIPDYYKGKKLTKEDENHLAFRGSDYGAVPKEGDRVRVYAKHDAIFANGRPGKYSGVYPDWFDVVQDKQPEGR